MCRVVSCVVGRECLLWSVHSFGKTLLAFALFHFVLQGQIYLLLQVSLDFLLLDSSPLWWKGHLFFFFGVSSEVLVGPHSMVKLQLIWHYWLGHRLGLLWYWKICLGNKCSQVLHSGSFVDYEGYSISSNGFLPTVLDIEENNRMGMTRDLFKKIRDQGSISCKDGHNKGQKWYGPNRSRRY